MRDALGRLGTFYGLQLRLLLTWRLGGGAMVRRLLLTTLISSIALAIAIWAVPGINAGGIPSLLAAVILIALLNSLFRPIVLWLAVPLGTLAVGVLATVLQFAIFIVVASVVP